MLEKRRYDDRPEKNIIICTLLRQIKFILIFQLLKLKEMEIRINHKSMVTQKKTRN